MAAVNITEQQFMELLQGEKPVLVDYWAPWCSYCRKINPAYDRIADSYGDSLAVVKINIDEETALAQRERIGVIPTLVLYKDAKAVGSIVAPESKAMIETFIAQSLTK